MNTIENNIDYRCKIYSLLEKMEVISEKKLDELIENEKKMGPIYEIIIDVKKTRKIRWCSNPWEPKI